MTRKTIVIAVREFKAAIRTKTFFISLIAMPVFMFGSIAVQVLLKDKVDVRDKAVTILDATGRLGPNLQAEAEKRNSTQVYQGEGPDRKKVRPMFVVNVELPQTDPTPEALRARELALSDQVRRGEIFAFVIIRKEALASAPSTPGAAAWASRPAPSAISYYSNTPTYEDFVRWMRPVVTRAIHEARLVEMNVDSTQVMQALSPVGIDNLQLVTRDAAGNIREAQRTNELASFFVPFGLLILMFIVVMVTSQPLLQSVLEEKMQRIAEVLVACASPFEIMMGKLLGSLGVSLVIMCVYFLGALYAMQRAGYGSFFPSHVVLWFVVFQCLGVLMYGSVFIAVGAAVNDLKEAQNLVTPLMLVIMVPFFLWLNVVREPAAPFAVAASLFPPATPMLMLVRMAVPPGIPLWQPILGAALVLASTIGCVFAAGRVFRIGLLAQGKAPKLGELLGWVIHG